MKYARHIRSKLLKTSVLQKAQNILPYVPETHRCTANLLRRMLEKYGMVYVKPNRGSFGWGVMKLELELGIDTPHFVLYFGQIRRRYASYDATLAAVRKIAGRRLYLVQRGISMTTHENCPFDIRVMVQLSPRRVWETTGYVARVAAPGRIVTNFHSGGTPKELLPLLNQHVSQEDTERLVEAICRLGEEVARHMHRYSPRIREIGLDIALEKDMRPWILEVNTNPHTDVFMAIGNWEMYAKIWEYSRAYGKLLPRPPRSVRQG